MDEDRNAPATKGDIADVRSDMKQMEYRLVETIRVGETKLRDELTGAIRDSETKLRGELTEAIRDSETKLRGELTEAIRDSETKLLKAFYDFAETNSKRHAHNEVDIVAFRSRMETIERRMQNVERRLNIPPEQ